MAAGSSGLAQPLTRCGIARPQLFAVRSQLPFEPVCPPVNATSVRGDRRAEIGQISIDPGKPFATVSLRSAGPQSLLIAHAEAALSHRNYFEQDVRAQIYP